MASLLAAAGLLPAGAIRVPGYRSGEVVHTPTMGTLAVLAVVTGGAAFVVWAALTAWSLARGESPV